MTRPSTSLALRAARVAVPVLLAALGCSGGLVHGSGPEETPTAQDSTPREPLRDLWLDREAIALLPTRGKAWERLVRYAQEAVDRPNIADQDDMTDVRVLARALVFARTGEARYRDEAIAAIAAAQGTEEGGRTLALGRNLVGYVLAADLVRLDGAADARFRAWLEGVRHARFEGRTLVSTHEDRPNNWGTHAGAARAVCAAYLGDTKDLERCAVVLRGWLGDRDAYKGFKFRERQWQADANRPVAVNPKGATKDGHSIDGVLPDDQRRAGAFAWPPPKENYVWEALQGVLVQALIAERTGEDPWEWSDGALLRAVTWLHEEADYPAEGDDTWQPWLVNAKYGTEFPTTSPSRPGKNVGFTDWVYGGAE